MPSPTSSIFGDGRGGIKTESLAGHGNVGGQGPGLVPRFLKHGWGELTSGCPRWGFPYRPEALVLAPTPGPCDCHYSPHVLSLTNTSLPCLQPRGDWDSVVHISTPSSQVFPLSHLAVPGLPLLPRQPRGHLDRLLVVPLHGNLSSRCWDSQMSRHSRLRDNRTMALGHPDPWMPTRRKGRAAFSLPSPL